MRTLTSLLGNSQKLDGGAMFGNAPKALWSRWYAPDDGNRISLACRALLVHENNRHILFETGIGAFFSPELKERYGVIEPEHVLLNSLQAIGLQDQDIDIVVLSHLHFDHAGGLLAPWQANQTPQLLFPNAQFIVGKVAWERACNPHSRDRASFIPELTTLLKQSGRLHVVTENHCDLLGSDYQFHLSNGHTPGMLLTEISLGNIPVLFAADLIPGAPWVHLPITMGYDRAPELLIDEKTELLAQLVARHGYIFFTHDPQYALAKVERDDKGRYHASAGVENIDHFTPL